MFLNGRVKGYTLFLQSTCAYASGERCPLATPSPQPNRPRGMRSQRLALQEVMFRCGHTKNCGGSKAVPRSDSEWFLGLFAAIQLYVDFP